MMKRGTSTQTASEIVGENVWFSTNFNAFSTKVPTLSEDHHFLPALVAPRPLFVIENTAIDWLGPESTFGCMQTGFEAYKALQKTDFMGYKAVSHPDHCGFPAAIQPQLTAFISRFLLNQSANTTVFTTDGKFSFNAASWINWTTPTLT
ncbi:hypothetical protein EXIGLDRAFT_322738 [Exidia glandulosa HHB12029]|nr:hypothetical protein EXIGLDRAFT_322738 [Exidia glandulosa HHB12029]